MAIASTNAPLAKAAAGRPASGLMAALREGFQAWRVYRETVRELSALSARELADLGMNRSMITRAALDAAYGKSN